MKRRNEVSLYLKKTSDVFCELGYEKPMLLAWQMKLFCRILENYQK